MVESAVALMNTHPEWQVDLLLFYTRRGLTASQRSRLPLEHPLVQEARARGLVAWQWEDEGRLALGQWLRLLHFVRVQGYDLIHTHEPKSDLLGVLLRRLVSVRVVATAHGYPETFRRLRLYRWIDHRLLRQLDHVITVSDALRRELVQAGVRPERLSTIYNALDVADFRTRANGHLTVLSSETEPVVLTAARLSTEKGITYFLEGAALVRARFPTARFLVVGDGPLRLELEAQAARLGLTNPPVVSFLGHRGDVASLMNQSSLVVVPSLREPFGVVLIEALALGKPVVATRVGGIPEIVEDRVTGLLVPPGDSRALAAAIERLLVDRDLAADLAQRGMRRVEEQFDVAAMAERTLAVYQHVLQEPLRPWLKP